MSAYIHDRSVGIQDPGVYCDGEKCGKRFSCLGELTGAITIERAAKDPNRFMSSMNEGSYHVPGLPVDEAGARKAAASEGWVTESVHGKVLDFCPACKEKSA